MENVPLSSGGAGIWGSQHAGDSSQRVRVCAAVRRAQDAGGGWAAAPCEFPSSLWNVRLQNKCWLWLGCSLRRWGRACWTSSLRTLWRTWRPRTSGCWWMAVEKSMSRCWSASPLSTMNQVCSSQLNIYLKEKHELSQIFISNRVHPTGENADKLLQFKRWFWSIVEKMSMTERQDLVSWFTSLESSKVVLSCDCSLWLIDHDL